MVILSNLPMIEPLKKMTKQSKYNNGNSNSNSRHYKFINFSTNDKSDYCEQLTNTIKMIQRVNNGETNKLGEKVLEIQTTKNIKYNLRKKSSLNLSVFLSIRDQTILSNLQL